MSEDRGDLVPQPKEERAGSTRERLSRFVRSHLDNRPIATLPAQATPEDDARHLAAWQAELDALAGTKQEQVPDYEKKHAVDLGRIAAYRGFSPLHELLVSYRKALKSKDYKEKSKEFMHVENGFLGGGRDAFERLWSHVRGAPTVDNSQIFLSAWSEQRFDPWYQPWRSQYSTLGQDVKHLFQSVQYRLARRFFGPKDEKYGFNHWTIAKLPLGEVSLPHKGEDYEHWNHRNRPDDKGDNWSIWRQREEKVFDEHRREQEALVYNYKLKPGEEPLIPVTRKRGQLVGQHIQVNLLDGTVWVWNKSKNGDNRSENFRVVNGVLQSEDIVNPKLRYKANGMRYLGLVQAIVGRMPNNELREAAKTAGDPKLPAQDKKVLETLLPRS